MNSHAIRLIIHAPRRGTKLLSLVLGTLAAGNVTSAQVMIGGTVAVAGAGALLDGDRPAYQEAFRQKKDGYGGLESFSVTRATDTSQFFLEGGLVPGNESYDVRMRYEKLDAYYVAADYRSFRTFYDGSGGRFLPRDLVISYFDEALALDRGNFALELGTLDPDRVQWRFRYDQSTRDGTKSSTRWGDSALASPVFGDRNLIPSYFLVDELRETVTLEASRTTERTNWKVAGRYDRTRVKNKNVARRNAGEVLQDRYSISTQGSAAESVTGHGFYERVISESLRVSAGGVVTSIDTHLSGSRIYGDGPDAAFSTTFSRRQNGDLGFFGLTGTGLFKQYTGNANVVYQATRYTSVLAGLKYERLRAESVEDHTETEIDTIQLPRPPGGGPGGGRVLVTTLTDADSASRDAWNEVTEDLELRYSRWADWQLALRGQWNQGTGQLVEQSTLLGARAPLIDRDTDYRRVGQRLTANATWYARAGLTLGAQYNYRLKMADYTALRDNTSNLTNSGNRYPSFISTTILKVMTRVCACRGVRKQILRLRRATRIKVRSSPRHLRICRRSRMAGSPATLRRSRLPGRHRHGSTSPGRSISLTINSQCRPTALPSTAITTTPRLR